MNVPFAHAWLLEHARTAPDAPCIGTPAGWTTYAALASRTQTLRAALTAWGAREGEIVINAMTDGAASVAFTLAAQSLGICVAEIDRSLDAESVATIRRETKARFAAVEGRDAPTLAKHRFACLWIHHREDPAARIAEKLHGATHVWLKEDGTIEGGPVSGPAPNEPSSDRLPALLVYTSGSTGAPRAVIQTHRNLAANTRAIVRYLRLTRADRACLILPLFYCYGKSVLLTHLYVGGSVYIDHRFMYPRVVLEAMAAEGCTGFAGVPLTYELLRRQIDVRSVPLPALRYVAQAGGAMHPDTIDWARDAFRPAQLFVMYGQTEATARITYLPPERAADKRGSVGLPVEGVELKVVDDDGKVLPPRSDGHVWAAGESITPGYFEAAEETSRILRDGWLVTGDVGFLDEEGFLFITGRTKEILKLGGHRVSAREIEEALARHPAVVEVAVAGTSDPVAGEAAVAFVVKRPGVELADDDVRRWAREHLAAYKVPRDVVFLAALPRTSNGKIARAELVATSRSQP
jgi:acyl-CoA synthetase (AMP-forming)/AMP-acid ligase II